MSFSLFIPVFFFFTHPAPTHLYTLSLHDALPISPATSTPCSGKPRHSWGPRDGGIHARPQLEVEASNLELGDRKSTRLNSSHEWISYAVFCLKKKKNSKYIYNFRKGMEHASHSHS